MIQPIFIIGLPRSGSTLWSNIIARDKEVMRFGEMHYLNPWHVDFRTFIRDEVGDLTIDKNVDVLVDKLFSGKPRKGLRGNYWEQIQIIEPDVLKGRIRFLVRESERSLGDVFKIIVDETTKIRGYEKCLIKFPVYANYVDDLMRWYPEAKIIHITRDPRAIAMSKTNDPGGTGLRLSKYPWLSSVIQPVMKLFVIIQYNWCSHVHKRSAARDNYALFSYEDLLADPEKVIKQLCKFSGIKFNESMLEPKQGQPSSLTGKRRHGFDPATAGRWRQHMKWYQASLITLLTKGSMKRYGYNPDKHPVYNLQDDVSEKKP